jgi:phage virion morphogenesis protein
MARLTITVHAANAQAAMRRILVRMADASPLMDQIGLAMTASTLLRFKGGVGPDGSPWAPLSPVTILRRRKRSSKPLLDTGRLRNSITHKANRRSVVIGTGVIYGRTHQFGARKGAFGATRRGSPIPWGDIPSRPFLGISDRDEKTIVRLVGRYLTS